MPKHFNTAGPCQPDIHYLLSPTVRLPELIALIDGRNYFIIHAPRQVGKTTAMLALAQELTASGQYTAVMLSVEVGAPFSQDPVAAEQAILSEWQQSIRFRLPKELQPTQWPSFENRSLLSTFLSEWAATSPRPLVVFLDEIDSLQDEALISILRQLRSGFPNRPQGFPHSLGLIGMRDVRDYKVKSGSSEGLRPASGYRLRPDFSDRLHTASPFNIKAESLTLRNFNFEEVQELYQQHTEETGQIFTPEAINHAFYLTDGQPWLVNALARQATQVLVKEVSQPITIDVINQAKEILIQRQDTHLDSLAERLREDRVRAIVEPMLAGEDLSNTPEDNLRYILDLGLCRRDAGGGLQIANPIYREILPKALAAVTIASLTSVYPTWLHADGTLNPDALLSSFLDFWRQHGEPLFRSTPYPEIAPHLVLMAFLHRVVNGGGTLEREYAIGSGRMDLCLRYGVVTIAMELKVWKEGKKDPLTEGLKQLDKYLSGLGLDTGWLVIFDRRENLPPLSDRTTTETAVSPAGRTIVVIRG